MESGDLQAGRQPIDGAPAARSWGAGLGSWVSRRPCAAPAALLVVVVMLAFPAGASAVFKPRRSTVDAPGLSAGPFITSAGLAWEGPRGIMLTNSAGRSTVLARPDAPNWDGSADLAWFGAEWWAIARPSGVLAGRVGGTLHALPLLRRCDPGSATIKPGVLVTQFAISGDHLYAGLPRVCLARRGAPFGEVVDIDLRSRRWRVLAPMPGTLEDLAAAGKYLAIAYGVTTHSSGSRLAVRVLNAATGVSVRQITPPRRTNGAEPSGASGIQVDNAGDVLVAEGCCGIHPGQLAHIAQPPRFGRDWWARAGSTVGHETHLGSDAALSDGRVAFLSTEAGISGDTAIDVRNLLAATTRTVVVFTGSASTESLALNGDTLAWTQQSTAIENCATVPLSALELASLDMRDWTASPFVVRGVPAPAQDPGERRCEQL